MSLLRMPSPIRVLALVLAVVFAVEAVVMLGLSLAPQSIRESRAVAILDSFLLVIVLGPLLWLIVVRPLDALLAERGRLLRRTLSVQEEERAKLSRDIHDGLGQAQTAVLLGLRAVADAESLDQARERAEAARQMAVAAVDAPRLLARGLVPCVLRDFGLGQALERVCEDISNASGIEIARELAPVAHVDPAVEIGLYRVVQEALTNAAKHSHATKIRVTLGVSAGLLAVTIADDGRGIGHDSASARPDGLGLSGMRERIVLLGGEFRIGSASGGGTVIRAAVPMKGAAS